MPDVVFELMKRRYAARRAGQEFVFESKDKEGHRKYATRAFESAYRRAGIKDASIHTMRHTFAAKFVQNGG
jgi:integrase